MFKKMAQVMVACLFFCSLTAVFAGGVDSGNGYWLKNDLQFGFYDQSFLSPNIPVPPRPLFWKAKHKVDSAYFFLYQRLLYHTQKYFSVYVGADVAPLRYKGTTNMAFAAFLAIHLYLFRVHGFSPYINYSIAGPTILQKSRWGGSHFSNSFVFQDMIGAGISLMPNVPLAFGFNVIHYSNGDIFPKNSGLQIPFEMWLSYSF
ncbi:MAG: hypothetical protein COB66_01965 [Coxiella sp. (in: Bacteria)]|nr:MAG: hypothetical protein COB66_01965 [Coxiella sp. (in: g-proteobacteria)]